jgi:tRNA(Ile)-lysidine synthase
MASSRKSNLADTVAARLAPLLSRRSHILVGLSGGMDSVVLLHLLHSLAPRFDWRLSALHVHHGISPNADAWADFCRELCSRLNVPLVVERVDIFPLRNEHGIEAAARKLRHAAFARQACDFVALAHHADDQVETLLLQMLRGAGIKGAAAMPVLSLSKWPVLSSVEGAAAQTLRPLLDISRATLLEYAQQHALHWVEDESNADDAYPRNFLRHRLLPVLEERFPAYRETLTRSARHFAEADALLDELAQLDGAHAIADGALRLDVLRTLSRQRAGNLLRYFMQAQGAFMPQSVQLKEMLQQLLAAREDAAVCIEFGAWQLRRFQNRAYVLRDLGTFDSHLILPWSGEAELAWPALNQTLKFGHVQGKGIDLEKLQQAPVTLRLRSGGEALRPHPKAATRSLKNLLQEHGIPPWRRERLPLLFCGDELVSVVGVAVSAKYQAAQNVLGLLVSCE